MAKLTDKEKEDMRKAGWTEDGIKLVDKDVAVDEIDAMVHNFCKKYPGVYDMIVDIAETVQGSHEQMYETIEVFMYEMMCQRHCIEEGYENDAEQAKDLAS